MRKILVIGGAGSAGINLVNRLKENYEGVEVLDIVSKRNSNFKNIDIPYHWKSLQDLKPDDIKDYNIVINFAAQADVPLGYKAPMWTCYQNIYGALNLFECLRYSDKIERIILSTSGTEYGRYKYLPIDENHPLIPTNPYSWSKASQEMCAMTYFYSYNLPVVILGSGVIIGPHMRKDIFIYKWLKELLEDKKIMIEGGKQTRDITYVDDVLDAYELVINSKSNLSGEKFQISNGLELSVEKIASICLKICNKDKRKYVIYKPYRPGERYIREYFDISKAIKTLGYIPKYTPNKAIELTYEWIKKNEQ